jgi:Holliday junction DNA helicase RuvB
LEFYGDDDLSHIVSTSAGKLNVQVDQDACLAMARRSRGTPRIANRLLRRCRDYAQVNSNKNHIDLKVVDEAMRALRIDNEGLDELDRRLLTIMKTQYNGGPVGIEALAATLNEETDTIEDVIEPYLLKSGFLRRTSRGRELTPLALEHLGTISNKKI